MQLTEMLAHKRDSEANDLELISKVKSQQSGLDRLKDENSKLREKLQHIEDTERGKMSELKDLQRQVQMSTTAFQDLNDK